MKILFVLLFTFYHLLSPPQASASTGLSISPPVTEVLISPNKSVSTTLQLTNTGDDTHLELSLHRLLPQGDQGHSTIDPQPLEPSSIPLVITISGASLASPTPLAAGQTLALTLHLEAANLDEPQDVYLALLARPVDPTNKATMPIAAAGVSALFLTTITPSPAIPTNVALESPNLPTLHDNTLPLEFAVAATNKAPVMLSVSAKITLTSPNKEVIHESIVEPKLILGNTTRQLSNFEFLISDFAFGPHTLNIELLTLGGRVLTSHSYTIWLLPLRYLLILLVALLLLSIPFIRKFRLTSTTKNV